MKQVGTAADAAREALAEMDAASNRPPGPWALIPEGGLVVLGGSYARRTWVSIKVNEFVRTQGGEAGWGVPLGRHSASAIVGDAAARGLRCLVIPEFAALVGNPATNLRILRRDAVQRRATIIVLAELPGTLEPHQLGQLPTPYPLEDHPDVVAVVRRAPRKESRAELCFLRDRRMGGQGLRWIDLDTWGNRG